MKAEFELILSSALSFLCPLALSYESQLPANKRAS
jgi:hypothetical protein